MDATVTINEERPTTGLWHDPALPASDRARALLGAMTTAEKIAQLGSTWPGHDAGGDVAPMQDTFRGAERFEDAIVDGLGHLTRVFGTAPSPPRPAANGWQPCRSGSSRRTASGSRPSPTRSA